MPIKQDNRLLAIKTATDLGPDDLGLRSFVLKEQVSRLFQIDAELSSDNGAIDFDKVVGHNATIRLSVGQKEKRFFNGVVSRMVQVANQGGYAHYRATIVPWLWFLTRTSDCCIFQDMTVPDIIEDVFKHFGFSDYKLKLSATYPKWEYCVQYRETDFNFVSRLMEQEGIYYYFEHENGKHTLVLADSISAHKAFPGYAEVTFSQLEGGAAAREVITDWTVEKEMQPVAYAVQDFDFKKPKTSLLASSNVSRKYGKAEYEIYDFPGEYLEHVEGERLADVRLHELQSQYEVLHGEASARGLAAGHIFKLKSHPRGDQNREYFVTGVTMNVDGGEFAGAGTPAGSASGDFFSCSFAAIDKAQQFRPARITPKPLVQGPQTAIVVGPSGEEIHTDEHARVKVHFHWDRHDKSDENSSCWIRVSQYWAGKQWGAMYIPRIGQEVIVEFLEGDPDEPIITGRVYNAGSMPPYSLPGKATVSTLKSNSSKGGNGFNEIRFEDKKGEEQLFVHGEKDLDVRIKNDAKQWIGHDKHLVVKNDQFLHVSNNRHDTVDGDALGKIGKDHSLKVAGKQAIEIAKNHSLVVKGDVIEVFEGKHSEEAKSDYYLKAKNIVIEAETNVTIKVGGSHIAIEAGGIKIGTSGQIKLQSDGTTDVQATAPLTLKSDATAELKSTSTTVKGDGMVTVEGGMVKIN